MNDTLHMDELRQTAKNFTKEEQRVILEEIDEELIIEQIKKRAKKASRTGSWCNSPGKEF